MQRLQAESRGGVREEDGERLLGVHQKLRRVVSVLKAILDTQINMEVKHVEPAGKHGHSQQSYH